MTTVFRSCLPRFSSNEDLSENSMDCLSIISDENITTNSSEEKQSELSSSSEQLSRLKSSKTTKKRGPRYKRINEKSKPFLTRLMATIFGGITKSKKRRSKKTLLPSKSKIEKQFEENEQTLNSLVTLLTEIESTNSHSIEQEQARNNNRIDDTSNTSFHPRLKRSNNKKSSLYSLQSSRKMIDNQQQTQLYPTKITIGTSTHTNDPSWFDVMHDDQTTSNAWARIRRRLKPNEQKDILR